VARGPGELEVILFYVVCGERRRYDPEEALRAFKGPGQDTLVIGRALHDVNLTVNLGSEPGWVTHDDTHRRIGGKKVFDNLRPNMSCGCGDDDHDFFLIV
jgi:hypothetical protein